jgi:hypothetical protein
MAGKKAVERKPYDEKIGIEFCAKLKDGLRITKLCETYDITPNDIKSWVRNNEEFAELYRDALSLYAARKVDEIEEIGEQAKSCTGRDNLTELKSCETQLLCISKTLGYLFPERYKEKSNEIFISLPEYGKAKTPKERLYILAQAVCDKRISVDAAEKLARICEIELKVTDFALFTDTVSERITRLESIIVKTNGLLSFNNSKAAKEAQY